MTCFHQERRRRYAGIVAGIGLAAALRFIAPARQSLWVDEVGTWMNVAHPGRSIARYALRENNAPPLYFWIVAPFVRLLGDGETPLRLLSMLSGVLSIPVFWALARHWFPGGRAADSAALLLAMNPLHLWYSQEARPYAFFLLLFLLTCLRFQRALQTPESRRGWLALSLLLTLCALTHTLALVLLPLLTAWLFLSKADRRALRPALAALAPFGALTAAIAAYVAAHSSNPPPPRPFSGLEIPYTFFAFLAGYSFGPPVREIQLHGAFAALRAHAAQSAVVALALAGIGAALWKNRKRMAWPIAVWLAAPIALAVAIALATAHPYNVRFALPALPAFLLLTAAGLEATPRGGRVALMTLLAGLSLISAVQWFALPAYGKEDSRAAVRTMLREAPNLDRAAVSPPYLADTIRYYLHRAGRAAAVEPVTDDIRAEADALLISRAHHAMRAEDLARRFSEKGARVFTEEGVRIYVRTPR